MNRRNKHFPPAAICDKDGKPLLSWRVAILPYLEQGDLYKQFHLDEPWDSPHNSSLIEKMPGTYMDLGPKADQLNHEGKTTFQVPVGPTDRVLQKRRHEVLRNYRWNVKDHFGGRSRADKQAVVWTKPEDWEVDLKQPRKGLERTDRTPLLQLLPTVTSNSSICRRSTMPSCELF